MANLTFNSVFEGLPKLVLSLSLLHVSACVLYILGYSFGFGGSIIILFQPSDIFGVGLRDLSYVYLSSLALPALVKAVRIFSAEPYAEDRILAIKDPIERENALVALQKTRKWAGYFLNFTAITLLFLSIFAFYLENPVAYVIIAWPIIILFLRYQEKIKNLLKIDYKMYEMFDLVLIFTISSLSFGALHGNYDRISKFSWFEGKTLYCEEFAIIRAVSENYLAVDPAGEKFVIDQKCDIIFAFQNDRKSEIENQPEKSI